jgi:hypothetical protein
MRRTTSPPTVSKRKVVRRDLLPGRPALALRSASVASTLAPGELPWLLANRCLLRRLGAAACAAMKHLFRTLLTAVWIAAASTMAAVAHAEDLPEYRLKAAFLYNFILFTEWPAGTGGTLNVCIVGTDPFAGELDGLQGKAAGARTIVIQRKASSESHKFCQVVFIAPSAIDTLPRVLAALHGQPTLTVADSPGAMRQGVALNMSVQHSKVSFEANVPAARNVGLVLSSKLLRLATEVEQ